ncbi:hypothetical protein LAJ19_20095 (plasmid) [Deinococcus taeanensis]|nr:hypothetical protein [Deinococcus taeanensis]UBV45500.1 hypothetical protein LAJ19_20095 [Deinococcus taeanensis]
MEDSGDRASLGFKTGVPGQMERDLAVQGGFRLEHHQEHVCKPLQGIEAAMRKVGFQVSGQRVSMQAGSTRSSSQTQILPLVMLRRVQDAISREVSGAERQTTILS